MKKSIKITILFAVIAASMLQSCATTNVACPQWTEVENTCDQQYIGG